MFERFTDRARRSVVLAQEEARMLDHTYIGTEHILLGLIHEGDGVAAKALQALDIRLEAVRREVVSVIGKGGAPAVGHIPFTPRAKKVLELSLRESLQLGHNYIGTEHILLGLIREGEGVAAQVLQKLGADLNRVRRTVIQLLSGYAEPRDEAGEPLASDSVQIRDVQTPGARVLTPACPGCNAPLGSGGASHRSVAAPAVAGESELLEVILVFCSACGYTVGVLPGERRAVEP